MPRVVLFAPYPHLIGGMERVTETVSAALPRAGWAVTVVAPGEGAFVDRLRLRGVPVEVVAAPRALGHYGGGPRRGQAALALAALPRYWWRLRPILRSASIVHAGEHRGALLAGPAARLAGVPMVWQVHSIEASRTLRVVSAALARVVVVPSASAASAVGWLPRRVVVVPNPVDVEPLTDAARHSQPDGPVVLSCGRLHPVKGYDLLLRALALLHHRQVRFRAVIAGDVQAGHEAHARELTALVAQLGLSDVVELPGFADRPFERWGDAAVYVQPSRHETFGLAAAEAMAAGLPTIVTGVGGLAELVTDGHTGLVVPPDDEKALALAIERMLCHPREADALAAAGRGDIRSRFGGGPSALLEVYASLAEGRRRRRAGSLIRLHRSWEAMAREDPLWAVLSAPEKRGGRWAVDDFLATGREAVDGVMALLRDLDLDPRAVGDTALDFGTGAGRLAQALAAHFTEVHGVDISESMLAEAERINRFPHRVHYHLNQSPDLGRFEDGRFAFVISHLVLQHMPVAAAKGYLREFGRTLVPGGVAVVQIPSGHARRRRFDQETLPPLLRTGLLRARMAITGRPGMEMHVMSRAVVEKTLAGAGLRVCAVQENPAGPWRTAQYVAQRVD